VFSRTGLDSLSNKHGRSGLESMSNKTPRGSLDSVSGKRGSLFGLDSIKLRRDTTSDVAMQFPSGGQWSFAGDAQ
jgi:hypothetical protein